LDLGSYRLSANSRSSNKLKGVRDTWIIYRKISKLPPMVAALWWSQYVWNSIWLYRRARPL